MSNMDISGETFLTKLAYICDYDDCGKLFVIRVEDFYLRKECPNCYNMFLKSENRQKLLKDGEILSCFYKCPSCGCRINVCAGKLIIPGSLIIFCYTYCLRTLVFY